MKKVIIAKDINLPSPFHAYNLESEVVRVVPEETGHDTNWYAIKFTDLSTDAISTIEAFVNIECQHA